MGEEVSIITHATGTFEIYSWNEEPCDGQKGAKLARARMKETSSGDVEGASTTDLLLAYAQEGSAPTPAPSGSSAESTAARAASPCTTASPAISRSPDS